MKLDGSLTDDAILEEFGRRLVQLRIDLSWTQAELASRAGIGKRTVERLENGKSVQAVGAVRVLRAFGLLETLDALIPEKQVRPMDLLKKGVKPRRRASSARAKKEDGAPWVWEDEK